MVLSSFYRARLLALELFLQNCSTKFAYPVVPKFYACTTSLLCGLLCLWTPSFRYAVDLFVTQQTLPLRYAVDALPFPMNHYPLITQPSCKGFAAILTSRLLK